MEPTGPHESVAGTISGYLFMEILRYQKPWVIKNCLIQPPAAEATALRPDVIVLDKNQLKTEPLWQREPIICNGNTIKLVVAVRPPSGSQSLMGETRAYRAVSPRHLRAQGNAHQERSGEY